MLDLSRLLPGPLCAQHLADLGASVVKIEDPRVGDYVRPAIRNLANRGKEALTLDLKHDAGRDIFLRLLTESHVVIESFRPGVMSRLGLDYAALASRNPAIVHCAITGYGQTGPRSVAAGHDINYLGLAGVLDQTGHAEQPPAIPGFLISDILGGTLTAAMGILAALVDARVTGRGRFVDVSMTDAVMAHCVLPAAEFNEYGHAHPRGKGPHTGGQPRYNIYAARDGRYIAVGAQEKKFWDVLCDALDLPALKAKHDPTAGEASEVTAALASAFATRDAAEWLARLEPLDCCVGPVLSVEEALAEPGFAARGTVGRNGDQVVLGLPLSISDHRTPFERKSPRRGEHTDAILSRLGFAPAEIGTLRAQGVV